MNKEILLAPITALCEELESQFDLIPEARKSKLLLLKDYIRRKYNDDEVPQLTVICTHNSRRSHLGQVWLAVGSLYYDLPVIQTFSGGTEATAFNSRAVAALRRVGFEISQTKETSSNPVYHIKWSAEIPAYQAFSKKYDSAPNPTERFGAILVCSEADTGCPVVAGADFRLFLPFEDPKAFDDTAQETVMYDERCRQIGRELLFALSDIRW
ncbi:MAG: hypothetical protein AAFO69_15080 [Bacteroidota bacterium]